MAKTDKIEEQQAAAEEAAEVAEVLNDQADPELSTEAVATPKASTKTKKAGPKSAKAVRDAEAEAERKEKAEERADKPTKTAVPKANPLKQHGKKYRQALEQIESTELYELAPALELAQKTSPVKFDASVEMHINLGVDPRQADQMVRSNVVLPAGTGKNLRVAVLAPADKQAEAKSAGADLVGDDDLIKAIEKGQLNFDILIATPQTMAKLGKLAKILGPKGLMPNPKSGTVTANVAEAVSQAKAGRVEFRIDKQAIIHQAIGKVSFKADDLQKNALAFINAVMSAKPAAAKGTYVKKMTVTTTMGPAIKLNHTQAIATANQAK